MLPGFLLPMLHGTASAQGTPPTHSAAVRLLRRPLCGLGLLLRTLRPVPAGPGAAVGHVSHLGAGAGGLLLHALGHRWESVLDPGWIWSRQRWVGWLHLLLFCRGTDDPTCRRASAHQARASMEFIAAPIRNATAVTKCRLRCHMARTARHALSRGKKARLSAATRQPLGEKSKNSGHQISKNIWDQVSKSKQDIPDRKHPN